jgi:GNS1/SUR4 family
MVNLCYFFMLLQASYIFESVYGELANRPVYKSNYIHVHHMTTTILIWIGVNFYPGGSPTLIIFLNSFVHTNLDSYFLVAGILFPALMSKTKLLRKAFLMILVSNRGLRH